MYENDPSLPATIVGNAAKPVANEFTRNTTATFTQNATTLTLTNPVDLTPFLSTIPGSDTFVKPPITSSIFSSNNASNAEELKKGDANFDFNTLISPLSYDKNGEAQAKNFLQFMSRIGTSNTAIRWASLTPEQKEKLQTTEQGRDYRVDMRSLAAVRSIALNNLYYLLAERMPQDTLGTQAGLTEASGSQKQIENYLATRRIHSKQWYEAMATASPTTLQRENLFVLAEMEQQLYQLHQDNERVLATLSAMLLQNTQMNSLMMQQKENQVKTLLGLTPGMGSVMENTLQSSGINKDDIADLKKELKDENGKEGDEDSIAKKLKDKTSF